MRSKLNGILLVLLSCCFYIEAQNYSIGALEKFIGEQKKSSTELIFTTFATQDYLEVLEKSIRVLDTAKIEKDIALHTNIIAALAKDVSLRLNDKSITVSDPNASRLFEKFKEQQYYLTLPKVSQFSKLMYYTCSGDYNHVLLRFTQSSMHTPIVIVFVIYVILFFSIVFKILKWKHRRKFITLHIWLFCLMLILFIAFKLTCNANVKEYSFYGFAV